MADKKLDAFAESVANHIIITLNNMRWPLLL